ncbi:aminotransferase class V-fold PLP-dependent enzyme [Ammoniphilus sp. CFH 90114]|uniref:aminotransferase class V-fold PLP-dependent enzyme n=1 Tax=Ammoniphilus sp. CFH 90114 TaxID=2493665 RepID=UPI00100E1A30|nr:aminotransferase class V-fold PLP-dependent enzyme [Ammoniphilus sp. CFH 90114]RXT07098.1 aminotransferase class V-fold PLP-dependent enzyme [Ammoniphilus sp. CFH 90114]
MSWSDFRQQFPILENKVYLATCAHGAQSTRVRDALLRYVSDWGEKGPCWEEEWIQELNQLKAAMAGLLNCHTEELAHSFSASVLLAGVISALPFTKDRNKIVTTDLEFAGIGQQWQAQKDLEGRNVEFVRCLEDRTIHLEQFEAAIDESTLLVSITHVNFENGFKMDIEPIIRLAHARGALVLVDSYQAVGVEPIDLHQWNVDFWLGGHSKYLLGVPGSVFLYTRQELANQLFPSTFGWHSQRDCTFFHPDVSLEFANGAERFQSGTRAVPCLYASRAGVELIQEMGVEAISKRAKAIHQYFIEEAQKNGYTILTPLNPDKRCTMTSLQFDEPASMQQKLKEQQVLTAARGKGLRFAFHAYNDFTDVDRTIEVLNHVTLKGVRS